MYSNRKTPAKGPKVKGTWSYRTDVVCPFCGAVELDRDLKNAHVRKRHQRELDR